jgi:hypothetical protein
MKLPDATKLDEIIDKEGETPTERILYRDVFAVACYLHKIGEKQAGARVIKTLFDHLGRNLRKTYFDQLMENLEGNQERFAMDVCAHLEVNKLFQPGGDPEQ